MPSESFPWVSSFLLLIGLEIVGRVPPPRVRPAASLHDTLEVDFGNDIAVSAEKGLGRAHLGAERQFALGNPVASVLLVLFLGPVRQRPSCAEGTFVHFAARAERALFGKLRRTEGARIKAVAAPDAEILVMQDDAVRGRVETVDRTDGRTRRVRAVHTGNGDGFL